MVTSRNTTLLSTLALIPARGGSKGVPRKNVMLIAGTPLIAYSILQAKTSNGSIGSLFRRMMMRSPRLPKIGEQKCRSCVLLNTHKIFLLTSMYFATPCVGWKSTRAILPDLIVHLRPTGPIRRVEAD